MFRFWRRIFAVAIALGVVSRIVITFEMGPNWGIFAAERGAVIDPLRGMDYAVPWRR